MIFYFCLLLSSHQTKALKRPWNKVWIDPNLSCSLALGDVLLYYHEHGHCSLFWVNPTYTFVLLYILSSAPNRQLKIKVPNKCPKFYYILCDENYWVKAPTQWLCCQLPVTCIHLVYKMCSTTQRGNSCREGIFTRIKWVFQFIEELFSILIHRFGIQFLCNNKATLWWCWNTYRLALFYLLYIY